MLHRQRKLYKPDTLFSSYLANMNMPGAASSSIDLSRSTTRFHNSNPGMLPDSMRVDALIRSIGAECSWPNDQLKSDITILMKNRIYTVKDLRTLSKESWRKIELLPIVKDLLRENINRGRTSLDNDFAKTERNREKVTPREILGSKDFKRDIDNANNIITPIQPIVSEKQKIEVFMQPIINDERKSRMHSNRSSVEQPKLFLPPPNKLVIGDRMKVKTASGKVYEVDRLCPHAKSDLSTRGVVIGSKLFCTKHCLSFDLENGGVCTSKHERTTINACLVNDW